MFYLRCCPEKLERIGDILAKFQGNRDAMYTLIERMFPGETVERPYIHNS